MVNCDKTHNNLHDGTVAVLPFSHDKKLQRQKLGSTFFLAYLIFYFYFYIFSVKDAGKFR